MSLPAQQVISSPYLAGKPTADTPPLGDSSALVPNTAFVQTAIAAGIAAYMAASPKVSQGTGVGQLSNQVKIGWSSGGQLLCTVDSTNLGNFLFGSDYTALQNQINQSATNLQNNINNVSNSLTGVANRPFAYTGVGQAVSFAGVTAAGIQDNGDLNVTGTITCNNDIWAFASDSRLKEDIQPIKDALSKVHQISGILYKFKPEYAEKMTLEAPNRTHMGVFAQDVEAVAPEAVGLAPFDKDENGESISGENFLTVQYDKLIALVIEAVKELDNKVNALDVKVNSIQAALSFK